MKFPSVDYLVSQAKDTFIRFTVPLLLSFTGAIAVIISIYQDLSKNEVYLNLAATCLLGVSLTLGSILFAERRNNPMLKHGLTALSVVLCIPYFFWLAPLHNIYQNFRLAIIFYVLVIAVHLWVAVAAYIGKPEKVGFWRFNHALFSRMVLTVIFSTTLEAGLSLAIAACDILFKLGVSYKMYAYLWLSILGFFNTWFFLTGVPRNYATINEEAIFPKPLKIFTQYILIPLVLVYMAILYVYGATIMVKWQLPRGWVSMLILSYEVVGILAILLVAPLRESGENRWIKQFSRFFFIASLPLIALLYVAIGTRIAAYGITESRYYLVLLGLWIGFSACYFLFSREKSIKMIPLTLLVVGVLSLWGPWGAFYVADASQVARLEGILRKYHCLNERGKMDVQKRNLLPTAQAKEVRSIVDYIVTRQQVKRLQYLTDVNLSRFAITNDTLLSRNDNSAYFEQRSANEDSVLKVFVPYPIADDDDKNMESNYYSSNRSHESKFIPVLGYATATQFNFYVNEHNNTTAQWAYMNASDSVKFNMEQHDNQFILKFTHGDTVSAVDVTKFLLKIEAAKQEELNTAMMTFDTGNIRILVTSLNIHSNEGSSRPVLYALGGWIMLR
jgi:hypothetical protein